MQTTHIISSFLIATLEKVKKKKRGRKGEINLII